MVPRQVLARVFHVRQAMEGTAFAIVVDGRQYIATAKHLIGTLAPGGVVSFEGEHGWIDSRVVEAWRNPDATVDVAVFTLSDSIGIGGPIDLDSASPIVGEQVFFAGFPYSMTTVGPEGDPPIPLVKHGIFSGLEPKGSAPYRVMIFDAVSNPGFSGGPIVFQRSGRWVVASIATSVMAEPKEVLGGQSGLVGPNAPAYVNVPAGFMFGMPITYAIEGARMIGSGPAVHE